MQTEKMVLTQSRPLGNLAPSCLWPTTWKWLSHHLVSALLQNMLLWAGLLFTLPKHMHVCEQERERSSDSCTFRNKWGWSLTHALILNPAITKVPDYQKFGGKCWARSGFLACPSLAVFSPESIYHCYFIPLSFKWDRSHRSQNFACASPGMFSGVLPEFPLLHCTRKRRSCSRSSVLSWISASCSPEPGGKCQPGKGFSPGRQIADLAAIWSWV